MPIVIAGSQTVMQNKYLANEKSIHAKTMLRTHPLFATREQHADLTCVSRNQVSRFHFVLRCFRLLFNSLPRQISCSSFPRIQRYEVVCILRYLNSSTFYIKLQVHIHIESIVILNKSLSRENERKERGEKNASKFRKTFCLKIRYLFALIQSSI